MTVTHPLPGHEGQRGHEGQVASTKSLPSTAGGSLHPPTFTPAPRVSFFPINACTPSIQGRKHSYLRLNGCFMLH